jgi:hypothetical protein
VELQQLLIGGGVLSGIALTITSLIRGWLVPAKRVDREQDRMNGDHTREVGRLEGECTYWRAAYERERDRADIASRQVDTLTTQYSATMHAFTRAALPPQLPAASGESR